MKIVQPLPVPQPKGQWQFNAVCAGGFFMATVICALTNHITAAMLCGIATFGAVVVALSAKIAPIIQEKKGGKK